MANKRKSMVIQEEIIRLKGLGHSQRKVAKILGIHRNTVRSYWEETSTLTEDQSPEWALLLDWNYIATEVENKVSLKILFEELSLGHELPSYSSFCRMCSKKFEKKAPEITVRVPRTPGESVETDYSGESIDIYTPSTGEVQSTELFVGTMSFSSRIYAEFTASQKLEDWIGSHKRMFNFYGGVPKFEITDNLKSGVTKAHYYDPEINRTFNDMARHYSLAIDPADKASPKQKPNVEKSVDILQKDFFPRIRNKTFTSLHELNKCLWEYLEKKNAEGMKDRGASRDFFFEQEKPFLTPLPERSYELFHWKKAKVHPDCCFQFNKNFYSVPHQFIGKEVELKFNSKMVYVFFETKQIKCHAIASGHSLFIIDEKDYPEKKLVDTNYHIQHALKQAKLIGDNTYFLVKRLIDMPRFPLKNLRKIQSVIGLTKKYSQETMEYASKNALELEKYSYHFINSCARNYRTPKDNRTLQAPKRQMEFTCLQGGKL